jgi:hypothetical protein
MGSAGMANQLYGQMRPGPSFLDKFNQLFTTAKNGMSTATQAMRMPTMSTMYSGMNSTMSGPGFDWNKFIMGQ